MNLEIHNPDLLQRVNGHIQTGQFQDADELLEKALNALEEKDALEDKAPASMSPAEPARPRTGQDLIDVCAKLRTLLTDEEIDTVFSRNKSGARPVDFE